MSDTGSSMGEAVADAGMAEDSVLQSAVWLAQELGIAMPPVPGLYVGILQEIALGQVFATDEALLDCDTPGGIAAAIADGWPASGLGFGYVARGSGGRWFYTLVGERIILHVSLRLQHLSDVSSRVSIGEVSEANRRLDAYLSDDVSYAAATTAPALGDEHRRRIVVYSDMDGLAREHHASWSPADGLTPYRERREIFSEPQNEASGFERIIWV